MKRMELNVIFRSVASAYLTWHIADNKGHRACQTYPKDEGEGYHSLSGSVTYLYRGICNKYTAIIYVLLPLLLIYGKGTQKCCLFRV